MNFLSQWCFGIRRAIYQQGIEIMASIADVQTAIASLNSHISTEASAVSAKLADLAKQISDLQAQVNQGGSVTSAQLDDVVSALTAAQAQVDGILPPTA